MKTSVISFFSLLFVSSSALQSATVITSDRVEAGTSNSFGSSTTTSGMLAVGINNTTSNIGSVAIGAANSVTARHGLAVGILNHLPDWPFNMHSNSIAVGSGNRVEGTASAVIGQNNAISSDTEFGGGSSNLLSGSFNYSYGINSIIAGANNAIPYLNHGGNMTFPEGVALFGRGLIGRDNHCTVVGKFNFSMDPPSLTEAPLFVVGNGTSESRSNAFEVRANGDIIISKPQGDISMGIYGD